VSRPEAASFEAAWPHWQQDPSYQGASTLCCAGWLLQDMPIDVHRSGMPECHSALLHAMAWRRGHHHVAFCFHVHHMLQRNILVPAYVEVQIMHKYMPNVCCGSVNAACVCATMRAC
jgi:hypothetical protein